MKRRSSFTTLAVILASAQLVSAPAVAEDERIVFQQDEFGWDFEKSTTLCVARGNFETGDGKTAYIELRKDSPADILKVLMATEGLRMLHEDKRPDHSFYRLNLADEPKLIVSLPPRQQAPRQQGMRRFVTMFDIRLSPAPPLATSSDASLFRSERSRSIAQVDGLHIDALFSRPFSLAMASFAGLSAQFDGCTDDILRAWGIDPEKQRSLTRAPYLTNFPDVMAEFQKRSRATQSQLVLTATISASGEMSHCRILPPAAIDLGDLACSVLREAGQFAPALDAGGQPVASYMTTRIIFQIG